MWKIQSSLKAVCMAAAALATFSCSQDDLTNQSILNGNTIITATFENTGGNTRTSVNDQNEVLWNKDDAFKLFYTTGTQNTPAASKFSCPKADGTSNSASFSGPLADGATTSYAVYPYQESMSLSSSTVTMLLPAEIEYTTASNGPMYADAKDFSKGIQFKHLAGLLKLTVSKGITTEAQKFVITADKNIAGTCTADLSTKDPVLSTPSGTGASSTITVTLNNITTTSTTFYIPIPAATYTKLSATLLGKGDKELCNPMEWNNIEVTRGGMRSASFGFVNIDASTKTNAEIKQAIADAIGGNTPATPTTTEIQLTGMIDATKGTSIIIPAQEKSNVNLTLAEVPTTSDQKPLELKDNSTSDTSPADAVNTMTFAIPKAEASNAPSLTITMPQTTVELDASGNDGTTYNQVTALTANSTLVIKKGVTVKNLIVKGGNVRVAGKIETISKDTGTSPVYLIKEDGATLPESTTGFTVINAATYDLMMAAKNGGAYTLNSDVILSEPLVVEKTMTLDLNGHSIKPAAEGLKLVLNTKDAVVLVRRGAQLTVNDSSSNKQGSIDTNSNAAILTAVKLTDSNDEKGENASQPATLIVNGGTIKGSSYGICGNGTRHNTSITINGGNIEAADATDGTGIYHPQDGTLTVNGGTISGHNSGIEIRAGKLEVKGGTIKHTAATFKKAANGNGTTITGAAVAVSQHTTNKALNVTISGGELQGGDLYALYEEDLQDENASGISMKVNGGKLYGQVFSENCPACISGGTFSDLTPLEYLGSNKATVNIQLNGDKTNKGFKTQSGQTVEINLNGHTLTLADPAVGSTGTETNSCQLLAGSKVTFKNGTVTSENDYIMIQNYCELLLENVTIEATNAQYVISNNNESCTISNSTITAGSGKCALDVFSFSTYKGVTVTVNDGSTINGNVEFGGNNNQKNGKLIINGGTFNGNLTVTESYYNDTNPNIIINGGSFGLYTGWSNYQTL